MRDCKKIMEKRMLMMHKMGPLIRRRNGPKNLHPKLHKKEPAVEGGTHVPTAIPQAALSSEAVGKMEWQWGSLQGD